MTDHSFNKEKMKEYQALVAPRIAKTHVEAGHIVTDSKYDISCHTCGFVFNIDMFYNQQFGYTIQIHVLGDGRPFTTAVIDEIRDIVYGTHKRFGIGPGKLSDSQRCRMYERAARYLLLMLAELAAAGPFDNAELEVKAEKVFKKLLATRISMMEVVPTI